MLRNQCSCVYEFISIIANKQSKAKYQTILNAEDWTGAGDMSMLRF
jgi:hypothetical protein